MAIIHLQHKYDRVLLEIGIYNMLKEEIANKINLQGMKNYTNYSNDITPLLTFYDSFGLNSVDGFTHSVIWEDYINKHLSDKAPSTRDR